MPVQFSEDCPNQLSRIVAVEVSDTTKAQYWYCSRVHKTPREKQMQQNIVKFLAAIGIAIMMP
jgi:hypothetical protein